MQKRVDTMELREEKALESEDERINKLVELGEHQLKLCMSMFEETECYKKLQEMEKATPKQLLSMSSAFRMEINVAIREAFIDVMANLEKCCPALTNDDLVYYVLSLMHCSNRVIIELMNVSSDALKMWKSRIKGKLCTFETRFLKHNYYENKASIFLLLINVASSKHEYFCDGSERRTSDNAKGYQGVRISSLNACPPYCFH